MRIAILADIHGNLPALEAALYHMEGLQVDQVVIAGDVVIGSPDSAGCWKRVCELECPILRGNQERYVALLGTPEGDPEWETRQFTLVQWAAQQFTSEERKVLGELPLTLRLSETPDLLVVHASARSDADSIFASTPEEELQEMFPGVTEKWIVRGHNHMGQVQLWGDRKIITSGSVGLPLDGRTTAQYVLLEQRRDGWQVFHQSVPYDIEQTIRRFEETGYLEFAGPMGRIYLQELATASLQIVPFLQYYEKWQQNGDFSLEDAVERFLSMY